MLNIYICQDKPVDSVQDQSNLRIVNKNTLSPKYSESLSQSYGHLENPKTDYSETMYNKGIC